MEDGDGGIPCPEDADFMDARPDAAEMEEAIGKFVNGLEQQERSGYHELHSLLSRLPVPGATTGSKMSHSAALEGGFLPTMDEEQQFLAGNSTPTIPHQHNQHKRSGFASVTLQQQMAGVAAMCMR